MTLVRNHIINFLVDVHDNEAVGIDEWSHVQLDANRHLRIGIPAIVGDTTIVGAGDIRNRLADKKLRGLGLRSLDARTLDDARVIVSLRRLHRHVPVGADVTEITQAAGKGVAEGTTGTGCCIAATKQAGCKIIEGLAIVYTAGAKDAVGSA